MERVNAALHLFGGRTAVDFFESVAGVASDFSSVLAAQALAFKVEDKALEQSHAVCPLLPQKRQKLLSIHCCCSCWVSLLFFPSLEERLGLLLLEELGGSHLELFDEDPELVEIVWFADSCNFTLDGAGKSIVELAVEGSVTPIDSGGEPLKADNVFSNFLVITHFELFKLILSISFDVKGTKVGPEFRDEFIISIRPSRVSVQVHE